MTEERYVQLKKTRLLTIILLGTALTLVLAVVSLSLGASKVGVWDVLGLLLGRPVKNPEIVLELRLPRFFTALIIGASLSAAGAVMQGLFRNPLVDPYVTGIASGAAFGAAVSLLFGVTLLSAASLYAVPLTAFLGAVLALTITLLIARLGGRESIGLVLSGVAVSFLFSAATTLTITLGGQRSQGILFWLFGSLITSTWRYLWLLAPATIATLTYLLLNARKLNVILLGDEEARQLGVDVGFLRYGLLTALSLLTALAVAFNGIIGFVGLVAPHIARLIVGEDYRLLLPLSIFTGSWLLLLADLAARTLIAPAELPVGAITSLIGAPFFLHLLTRRGVKRNG